MTPVANACVTGHVSESNPRPRRVLRPQRFVLHRRVITMLFYLLAASSLLHSVVLASPVRFTVVLGSSQLREVDLLMVGLVGVWFVDGFLTRFSSNYRFGALYLLLVVLLLPIVTGLAAGKAVGTVLRDCRTPLFFASLLPMLDVLRTPQDLERARSVGALEG